MAGAPASQAPAQIPFTRGSSLATMQDALLAPTAGGSNQVQLQTNAFLEFVIMDVVMTTAGNSASVAYAADGPFNVISNFKLDDPAGQSIISPITGYQLYLLNKYLQDTACRFDPQQDPNYAATGGTVATGGSFSFRLVVPVEHRRRDALGAVNNSAANQRYLITINWSTWTTATTTNAAPYTTLPSIAGTLSVQFSQAYWTSPPGTILTPSGNVAVTQTPAGLGSVGFVRYERHNEVAGGGSPLIQLNNVGDYISSLLFILRQNSNNVRDSADWPSPFAWWVNDFQVLQEYVNVWQREMARSYGYTAAIGSAGGLDTGVFVLPFLNNMFDRVDNFAPANQYLATDATTKLQIRGSTFGSGVASTGYLEVVTRLMRPVSGSALFS
jgi:hypothetical protein